MVKGVQRDFPLAGVWGCPPAIYIPPLLEERGSGGEVNGNNGIHQVIANEAILLYPVVMLNLFQHLSFQHPLFQCIILVIASPDLLGRGNLSVSPPLDCFVAIAPRNDSGKGSPEGFPSGGGLGESPSYIPPLLDGLG